MVLNKNKECVCVWGCVRLHGVEEGRGRILYFLLGLSGLCHSKNTINDPLINGTGW